MNHLTTITIDIARPLPLVVVHAKQNDTARSIAVKLIDNGVAYTVPNGTTQVFRAGKPDGTGIFTDQGITVSGNTVTILMPEQTLTAPGTVNAEINLYNSDEERLTSFAWQIVVEKSVITDTAIVSSDYYNVLTAKVAAALQAALDAAASQSAAATSAINAAASATEAAQAVSDAVSYSAQTGKSAAQKTQARTNIGAAESELFSRNGTVALPSGYKGIDVQPFSNGISLGVGVSAPNAVNNVDVADTLNSSLRNAIGAASNRNLLDNWDFRNPVNQRSGASYSANDEYCLDRWKAKGITISQKGAITAISANAEENKLYQLIEKSRVSGTSVTISFLYEGELLSASGDPATGFSATGTKLDVEMGAYGDDLYFVQMTPKATGTIVAAKAELGSVSTLDSDPPADYGTELVKCQRYYVHNIGTLSAGYMSNATANLLLTTNVAMRAKPIATIHTSNVSAK